MLDRVGSQRALAELFIGWRLIHERNDADAPRSQQAHDEDVEDW